MDITSAKNFPQFVRKFRRKYGFTQKEVGKLAGFKSGQFVSNIERGNIPFSWSFARFLLDERVLTGKEAKFLKELVIKTAKKIASQNVHRKL